MSRKEAEAMQTFADALREQGRQEGEREILVRLVRGRFGKPPAPVLAGIEAADLATRERLIDAPTVDERPDTRTPVDRDIVGWLIDRIATEVDPKAAEMMRSVADTLREEGRQEGEREILVRLVRGRFGKLPAAQLARIEAADLATLEPWSERLFDARSLDELLDT